MVVQYTLRQCLCQTKGIHILSHLRPRCMSQVSVKQQTRCHTFQLTKGVHLLGAFTSQMFVSDMYQRTDTFLLLPRQS